MPFRDIVGHRRLVALLSRAIARDTLPPALLLAGPAGIGKQRVARAVAEALNCLDPRVSPDLERDACGACAACRRIERGVHGDVLRIAPGESGAIKIEQVRDAIDRAGYRPFEGRRRVVIIDEADALVPGAQNALLKTLEEPPSASVFILVSSMPDALLPTVLSRCPRLRCAPLIPADLVQVLVRDHEYEEADARVAAAAAGGSVGRALSAESADLTEARETAKRLLRDLARLRDPARRLETAKDLTGSKGTPAGDRDQLAACLRALATLVRDLGIIGTQADPELLSNADLREELDAWSRVYDRARSTRAYMAIDEALAALERNASPKIVADWLALRL